MVDSSERPPLYIAPTAETNNFDHELHISVFDYLADAYLAGKLTLDEVAEVYQDWEGNDG